MSTDSRTTSHEAAIRTLVENWAASVRARNLDGILAHHAADILMFDVPPPFESKGIDAYRRTWDLFYGWSDDPVVFAVDRMDVTAGDEVAYVTALMRCAGKDANGARTDLDFRLTIGLRRIDGEWTVTHEHHSVPAV
jgi:uncharacterized protein (TIGR02246 family)